ncbi:glycosyltransferase family 2 protein [Flavobacterium difficile]|uniref:Glycosyltransferase n=1 Tax=Flavobacterium difficile TaxID=2709659 RepID=A0ABX0I2W8_9FLAO|nr:glycosyltransferase [Flavobacterium difficile]NHM01091.1 glycosyltransferase [Flavobacterium difficile]
MTLLSIALPVFNGANFIREAIESILQQDSLAFELVVVDNASTDNTVAIVSEYQSDSRLKIITCPDHVGQVANVNRSVSYCSSKWIHFFCHDDIMLKGCVTEVVRIISNLPTDHDVALISHQPAWLFSNQMVKAPFNAINGVTIHPYDVFYKSIVLEKTTYQIHPKAITATSLFEGVTTYFPALTTAVVRKDIFLQIGQFDAQYIHFDIFLWMKLVRDYAYIEISEAMTLTRIHGAQVAVDARKTFRTFQDNRLFWPNYLSYLGLPKSLKNKAFIFLKCATTATGILAVTVLKSGWISGLKLLPYLPFWYWWFIILYLPMRVWREKQNCKEIEQYVPLEYIYP